MGKELAIVDRANNEFIEPIIDQIRNQLPPTLTIEKFKSAFIIAVQNNPKLLNFEVNSVRNALIKCAMDGLVPDGRLAAIVPFNDEDLKCKVAIYIPMVQGIIRRAYEMGEIFSIACENVYQKDEFIFDRASGNPPSHIPPKLGEDRGPLVGAYVIFRSKAGQIIHTEVMDLPALTKTQGVSRAKKGPWKEWYDEMTRKTVIRRGAKYVPMSDAMRRIIEREDEHVDFGRTDRLVENNNPLIGNQINSTAFSYDDLTPGLFANYARALSVAEGAPTFTKAEKEFWEENPEVQPSDEDKEKLQQIWQLNVDRIKKSIELPAFYDKLKEIIGIQESGAPRSGTPEEEGTPSAQDNSSKDERAVEAASSAGRGTGESSSPDLTPETAEQYEAYARNKVIKATDAAALGAWWKSKAETELQKSCKAGPELLQTLKKSVLEKIAELKPGRNIGAG